MQVDNIIKALEFQRNAALTQNVELLVQNFQLQAENEELRRKISELSLPEKTED